MPQPSDDPLKENPCTSLKSRVYLSFFLFEMEGDYYSEFKVFLF